MANHNRLLRSIVPRRFAWRRRPSSGAATMFLLLLHFVFVIMSNGFSTPIPPTGVLSGSSWSSSKSTNVGARRRHIKSSTTKLSCICVNCNRVTNCAAYHFVETKHEQPHMTNHPTFTPRSGSPTIHVNWRNVRASDDEEETRANDPTMTLSKPTTTEGPMQGVSPSYDPILPQITYEYDVVACEDFVEDVGCWVRNMPEEIKLANPHFVPP